MIIAVDFDGTLVENRYPEIGALKDGAKEIMRRLYADGHYIILWTCRTGKPLIDAINFLLENGMSFSRVNDHNPDNLAQYGGGAEGKKIFAHVYIDDQHVGKLPDWPDIYEYICNMPGPAAK